MLRWALLCALIGFAKAQTTAVSPCITVTSDLPINAYVQDCTTPPCQVQRGSDAIIHLIFRAPHLITSMETRVTAQVPLIGPQPWDLQEDGVTCNFLTNGYCPVLPGEVLQYTLRLTIPSIAPALTLPIEFYVVDQNEDALTCVRVAVTVLW